MDLTSVIITTYGAPNHLSRAINSVLNQTVSNIEIIVVDDNSPESKERTDTTKVMEDYININSVIYIQHPKNLNGAVARNTGIGVAKGKYIAFLDNDDFFMPDKIEKCVNAIENNAEADIVLTNVVVIRNGGIHALIDIEDREYRPFDALRNVNLLGTGSNLFLTRKVCCQIQGFDESFLRHQDVEFFIRILEVGKVVIVSEYLTIKVHTGTNIPNYVRFKSVKAKITNKFEYLISYESELEQRQYYINMCKMLLDTAIESCDRVNIQDASLKLKQYRKLSIKEQIFSKLPNIRNYLYLIKAKQRSKTNYKKYIEEVDVVKRRVIENTIVLHP